MWTSFSKGSSHTALSSTAELRLLVVAVLPLVCHSWRTFFSSMLFKLSLAYRKPIFPLDQRYGH